jgi:predicted nucleic acid-binding protein
MTRYVIGPDVALALAEQQAVVPARHRLLAPTLLRSQVLAQLYTQVRLGKLARKDADRRLDHLRKLNIRLLGDRVLQRVAWQVAEQLDWELTFVAEYVALTRLQADALVVRDEVLARSVSKVVPVADLDSLLAV